MWWVFVLGLAAVASRSAAAQTNLASQAEPREKPTAESLLPPHCTVVLLSGLPGDVESENDYRAQLQGWLEILATGGQTEDVLVLCDHPESVSLPEKLPAQVLKADRTSFLNVGSRLAGRTNSLTVLAWGHGGRQGNTPVFHVRGPRLTAADFQALASRVQTESRWVLLFRGSGSFAGQLAGQGRQVLASECDTMFASDPVGMGLLLTQAREQPGLSFEALAEQLGRATAAWYAERNLAQTEQPTLWMGTQKAQLLSPAEAVGSVAELKAATTNVPLASMPEREPGDLLTTNLPAAWKDLKRVQPDRYPEADGVVLRQRLSYTLANNPAIATDQEEFIQCS